MTKQERANLRAKEWYLINKDRKREYDANRRIEKRYLYREASKRWRDTHPLEKKAYTDIRRDRVKQATPQWANKFFMKEIYSLAKLRSKLFSIEFHVDHVIPLNGKDVCGLHVENNLQIISRKHNMIKSNHYSFEYNGVK